MQNFSVFSLVQHEAQTIVFTSFTVHPSLAFPVLLGLCGNYNGDTTDDFMTSMDITEGTASLFVDSWRAGNCHPALERDTDPCALSQLNSK